jgi:hypothetical protein
MMNFSIFNEFQIKQKELDKSVSDILNINS